MRRARRLLLIISTTFVLGYALICAVFFAAQRSLLYPEEVLLSLSDGSRRVDVPAGTFFLWHEGRSGSPVIVYFHANGDQVSFASWMGEDWNRQGVSFAAVEYPGYPGAEGAPSEEAINGAAEAALRYLTVSMKVAPTRIVLVGQSLGTGVALEMAARGWGVKLVLISPYTSRPAVAGAAFPLLPCGWLVRDRFDSEKRALDVKIPTLVLHGTRDSVVPFEQGERVSSQIPGAVFCAVPGGHHHDVLEWGSALVTMRQFILR